MSSESGPGGSAWSAASSSSRRFESESGSVSTAWIARASIGVGIREPTDGEMFENQTERRLELTRVLDGVINGHLMATNADAELRDGQPVQTADSAEVFRIDLQFHFVRLVNTYGR